MPPISDISIRLRIEDDGAVRVVESTRQAIERLSGTTTAAEGSFSRLARGVIVANQAWELLGRVSGVVTSALRATIAAADEQDRATARLAATLRATGQASADYLRELQAQAAAYQRLTVHGDEAVNNVQRLLVQFGAQRQQIEPLTRMVLDLASAYDMSIDAMAELVGGALGGRLDGLLRTLRLRADEGASAQEKWSQVIDAWRRTMGQAEAEASTFGGRMAQVRGAIAEALEQIGAIVTRSTAVTGALAQIRDAFFTLADAISQAVTGERGRIDEVLARALGRVAEAVRGVASQIAQDPQSIVAGLERAVAAAENLAMALGKVMIAAERISAALSSPAIGSLAILGGGSLTGALLGGLFGGPAGALVGGLSGLGISAPLALFLPGGGMQPGAAQPVQPALTEPPPFTPAAPMSPIPEAVAASIQRTGAAAAEAAQDTSRFADALSAIRVRSTDAAKAAEDLRVQWEQVTDVISQADRTRAETAREIAAAHVERARALLERAQTMGPEEQRAAMAAVRQAMEEQLRVEESLLQAERERLETAIQLAQVMPTVFDPRVVEAWAARVEQIDATMGILRERVDRTLEGLDRARAAAVDVVEIIGGSVSRAVTARIAGGGVGDIGLVLRDSLLVSVSDIVGSALAEQSRALKAQGAGVLTRLGAGITGALVQGGIAQALAGMVSGSASAAPVLAALAGALGLGAITGGTLATLTGASSLASTLGISLSTLGAAAGGLGLAALIAGPIMMATGPGTTRFGQFDAGRSVLSVGAGAAAGAALGSIIPGIGTAIGAAIGGLLGALTSLFGASQTTAEDRALRAIETVMEKAGLSRRIVFRDESGRIVEGPRLADTVIGRDVERLIGMRDRGNLAGLIAAIERRPAQEIGAVQAAVQVPAMVFGRAMGLADPAALGNTIANMTLALGRGAREAEEWLLRAAQAAGIDFRGALVAVHDQFERGQLSASQLEVAVAEIARLFGDELPPGFDVARIAMRQLDAASQSLDLRRLIQQLDQVSQAGARAAEGLAGAIRALAITPDDQLRDAQTAFAERIGQVLTDAIADVSLAGITDQMRRVVGDVFAAIQAGDAEAVRSATQALFDFARGLQLIPPQLRAILDALQGPARAQALLAEADRQRERIRQIELARMSPAAQRATILQEQQQALAALRQASGVAAIDRARIVEQRSTELLQLAGQFAAGSAQRRFLEQQALTGLRESERVLREQAAIEQQRFEEQIRAQAENTAALRENTAALRAQLPVRRPGHRTGRATA
jgi:hypothetical protein